MDSLKKPETAIAGTSLLASIITLIYVQKQNSKFTEDIEEIQTHLFSAIKSIQENKKNGAPIEELTRAVKDLNNFSSKIKITTESMYNKIDHMEKIIESQGMAINDLQTRDREFKSNISYDHRQYQPNQYSSQYSNQNGPQYNPSQFSTSNSFQSINQNGGRPINQTNIQPSNQPNIQHTNQTNIQHTSQPNIQPNIQHSDRPINQHNIQSQRNNNLELTTIPPKPNNNSSGRTNTITTINDNDLDIDEDDIMNEISDVRSSPQLDD